MFLNPHASFLTELLLLRWSCLVLRSWANSYPVDFPVSWLDLPSQRLWVVVWSKVSLREYNVKGFLLPVKGQIWKLFSLVFKVWQSRPKSLPSSERIELNKWKIMKKNHTFLHNEAKRRYWDEHLPIHLFFIHSILIDLQLWERHCSNWGEEYTVDWSWMRGGIPERFPQRKQCEHWQSYGKVQNLWGAGMFEKADWDPKMS